jgi:hypothetical protein
LRAGTAIALKISDWREAKKALIADEQDERRQEKGFPQLRPVHLWLNTTSIRSKTVVNQ